jgi:Kelch motif
MLGCSRSRVLPVTSFSAYASDFVAPIFAVLTALLSLAPVAKSQDLGQWITRANTPVTRSEAVGARIGDNIYLVGGFGTNGGARDLQIYTPSTNSWRIGPQMPVGLHHPNVAAWGGKLFVLGGCTHGQQASNPYNSPWVGSRHAFEYDPAQNAWRTLKPLQQASAAGALLPFGDKLYLIGGVDTTGLVLDKVQEYDPVAETWRERAPMSLAREHIGAAVLDSLIYVVAGRETGLGGVSIKLFQAYDPVRNTWQTLPELPTARSGLCLTAAKGRLYAMGGEWPGTFDLNEEYDPVARAWRTVSKMSVRRHGFAAVNFNDTVYVMGMVASSEAFIPPVTATTRLLFRERTRFKNRRHASMPHAHLGWFVTGKISR